MPSPTPHMSRGERRQLTVMFCDLVGSTVLAQRIDPEDLRDVIHAYQMACASVVEKYGGHVAQLLGDGVMVYFGWPDAHENDAERGVRAALDIVQAVTRVSAQEPLAVRIGVASGPVVVGGASGGINPDDGLAVGETPNLAARLQTLAGRNEVVIAPATRRLVGHAFELSELDAASLKGIDEPLRPWRVLAVKRNVGRFHAAHGGAALTPLVGRDAELAQLLDDWRLATAGTGRTTLVCGEPGIGKSRLTEGLRDSIAGQPHTTLRYQCSPFQLNAALYPVVAHAEFAAGFAREDTPEQKLDKLERILVGTAAQREETAPLFAALLSLPTDRYAPTGLSPQQLKEKTFEALIGQIEALSQAKPVLMIVEDAHWVDPTTQELLNAMVPRLQQLSVLLVLTFRPHYAARWPECAHVTAITLTGLPQRVGAELAGNIAKGKMLPAAVVSQLVARADGVPLFIEELTKSVLESRLLLEEADRYTLQEPLPALVIPSTLSALLMERLGRRDGVRELAQLGACIGREFSYELLAAVSERIGDDFDEELAQLTATELVFSRGVPPTRLTPSSTRWCRTPPTIHSSSDAARNCTRGLRMSSNSSSPSRSSTSRSCSPITVRRRGSWSPRFRYGGGPVSRRSLAWHSRRRWPTFSRASPSSIDSGHPRIATGSNSRFASRCTPRGCAGEGGRRRRWA
jgi:class 3 adenylate cyclase